MIKRHFAVFKNNNGQPVSFPLKEYLRDSPQDVPEGMDANDDTTYQLKRALKKKGWEIEDLADRVLVIKPDEKQDTAYADELFDHHNEDEIEDELVEAEEITFGLERDMQAALRRNIEQLEKGLKITDGGKERVTEAGKIDITAQDSKGNIVVIELKAGDAKSEIITQVLAYMSAVMAEDKKPVRGISVAGNYPKKVILAARSIPNLELKKYSIQFTFEKIT